MAKGEDHDKQARSEAAGTRRELGHETCLRYGVDPGVAASTSGFGMGERLSRFAAERVGLLDEIQSRWQVANGTSSSGLQRQHLWPPRSSPFTVNHSADLSGSPVATRLVRRVEAPSSGSSALAVPTDAPKTHSTPAPISQPREAMDAPREVVLGNEHLPVPAKSQATEQAGFEDIATVSEAGHPGTLPFSRINPRDPLTPDGGTFGSPAPSPHLDSLPLPLQRRNPNLHLSPASPAPADQGSGHPPPGTGISAKSANSEQLAAPASSTFTKSAVSAASGIKSAAPLMQQKILSRTVRRLARAAQPGPPPQQMPVSAKETNEASPTHRDVGAVIETARTDPDAAQLVFVSPSADQTVAGSSYPQSQTTVTSKHVTPTPEKDSLRLHGEVTQTVHLSSPSTGIAPESLGSTYDPQIQWNPVTSESHPSSPTISLAKTVAPVSESASEPAHGKVTPTVLLPNQSSGIVAHPFGSTYQPQVQRMPRSDLHGQSSDPVRQQSGNSLTSIIATLPQSNLTAKIDRIIPPRESVPAIPHEAKRSDLSAYTPDPPESRNVGQSYADPSMRNLREDAPPATATPWTHAAQTLAAGPQADTSQPRRPELAPTNSATFDEGADSVTLARQEAVGESAIFKVSPPAIVSPDTIHLSPSSIGAEGRTTWNQFGATGRETIPSQQLNNPAHPALDDSFNSLTGAAPLARRLSMDPSSPAIVLSGRAKRSSGSARTDLPEATPDTFSPGRQATLTVPAATPSPTAQGLASMPELLLNSAPHRSPFAPESTGDDHAHNPAERPGSSRVVQARLSPDSPSTPVIHRSSTSVSQAAASPVRLLASSTQHPDFGSGSLSAKSDSPPHARAASEPIHARPSLGSLATSTFVQRATAVLPSISKSAEPPPQTTPSAATPSGGNQPAALTPNVAQLANQVYELLVRRLASERQRRGA